MTSYPRADIIAAVRASPISFPYEILPTREDVPTIRITNGPHKLLLHSKFKPLEETEKITAEADPNCTVIIIGGFGLGYLAASLLAKAPHATVIILEKDAGIVRCALENNPTAEAILFNERLFLFFDPDDVITLLQTGLSTKAVSYYFHRPSVELHPAFYSNFRAMLLSFLQKKNINMATLSRFERIWARNITKNLSCILKDGGVSEFFGSLKGVPAVLVCAGPSLDQNITVIKKLKDKCFICAVDSAVNRLLHEGIMPDIIFTVDPQLLNFYFFFLTRKYNVTAKLVYEPSTYFRIPNGYTGPRYSFDSVFPLIQWVAEITSQKGTLDMGGSVSTSAFDLLYQAGASCIIMIGQDMAFRYNKTHASGSLVEYVLLKRVTRTRNLETQANKLTSSNVTVKLKSNSGTIVNSDRRLLLFYWWFENKIKNIENCPVYNLSADGAAIRGVPFITEDEIIAKIGSEFGFFDRNHLISVSPKSIDIGKVIAETKKMITTLTGLKEKITEAVGISQKAYRAVKVADLSVVPRYIKSLDVIDKFIESRNQANRLIGITMQKVIHSIIEDYEDYLTDEEKANKDLATIRKSVLMYTEMEKSVDYNLELFRGIEQELGKN